MDEQTADEKLSLLEPRKILFLTASEYGEANVIISVAYEHLLRRNHEIHIGSFSPLRSRVDGLNTLATSKGGNQATFHNIRGPSMDEAISAKNETLVPYPPGVRGTIKAFKVTLPMMATAWDGPQYLAGHDRCVEIIRTVKPDLLVIGSLMNQGQDACQTLEMKCVILSPNTFREILNKEQPILSQLLRYPSIASAFPYPVPWHLIPINFCLKFGALGILLTSSKLKELMRERKSQNLAALPPAFNIWRKEYHYLLPSIPETDFSCKISSNVTPCGPILIPVPPVEEVDPKLDSWLRKGPTMLINLGSHISMDDCVVREFAAGLKVVLETHPKLQILWKLKTSGRLSIHSTRRVQRKSQHKSKPGRATAESLEAISSEITSGRVRIEEWLSVDPLAVLQSGHVSCAVHHGGSNSFHEALSVGVPQVVLPCWLDTFDFANRVEYLGIGVFGSRKSAPGVETAELSNALLRVLGDGKEASAMRAKAKALAQLANMAGGRVRAADELEDLLDE